MPAENDAERPRFLRHYEVVRELGRGGMGSVYEGVDRRDGGRVAIKVLHPWLASADASFRDRFEREAHIAALLRSPYTVHLLDYGVQDGTYVLVMEYIDGQSVAGELSQGPIPPQRALRVALEAARALEEAGARGVVHRDIKPENILISSDGHVKVTDFGIARQEGSASMTAVGGFIGTAAYAAPEQAGGPVDARTDIYSLGATLYCMLAGRPPFDGPTTLSILKQHHEAPVPMAALGPLPDAVTNPIRRCMEKDPRDRYQTATELAGALERALSSLGRTQTPAAPAPRPAQPTPPASARPPESPRPAAAPATDATRVQASPPAAQQPPRTNIQQMPLTLVLGEPAPRPGAVGFLLEVRNSSSQPVRATLSGQEPQGVFVVESQGDLELPPFGTARIPVEVRQLKAPARPGPVQFQVAATGQSGERVGFVNGQLLPTGILPKGEQRRTPWLLIAGIVAGLAVAGGAVFAFMSLGGDDPPGDEPPAESPTAALTRTPTADSTSPTPTAAGPATPTLLPTVRAPQSRPSVLQSGATAVVVSDTCIKLRTAPTDQAGAASLRDLCKGDRVIVATNSPVGSTYAETEGLVFWRVVVEGTQVVGWTKEMTLDGSIRFLDRAR